MLSRKENGRIHSNEFTPTSRLKKRKNEVNPSLSYDEKLFKLYDGVETFVMFIGYPRSGHSLVAAILDAHPEIIISHQYNVLKNWRVSISTAQKNLQKYQLFFGIHKLSRDQASFGNRASPINQTKYKTYNYNVPGSWQGKYQEKIKVSNKVVGKYRSMSVSQSVSPSVSQSVSQPASQSVSQSVNQPANQPCSKLSIIQAVQVPIRLIHVTRNPFDNISTMMLRATHSRDVVREEGVKGRCAVLEKRLKDAGIAQTAHSNEQIADRSASTTTVQQRASPAAFTKEQITEIKRLIQDSVASASRDIAREAACAAAEAMQSQVPSSLPSPSPQAVIPTNPEVLTFYAHKNNNNKLGRVFN
ncbi:hypothetical protein ACROYT_G032983 [Oculina patagonica]